MIDYRRKDICEHGHYDCFARGKNGYCRALSDTDFGYRDCPFYKTKEQVEKEERERLQRERE